MPVGLFKFTPALEDPKILQAASVGREGELKRLLQAIKEGAERGGNQHFLLVGPRGIGKTHLLLLIYHSVKGTIAWDELGRDLGRSWMPILFAEEEYRMTSLVDLLLEVLARLKEELKEEAPDESLVRLISELEQVPLPGEAERELVLEYLLKRREENGRKFLLLLDNLHDVLPYFTEEDQGRLRDILMSEDLFMLIGTAPTLFETVIDHEAPFYNFFEVIWLQEIEEEQVKELIAKRLKLDRRDDLLEKLGEYEGRLKALVHLTGGNPRLILSLYQIFAESKILEVERDFKKLLDEMTPYFQDRMKELSPQQRKVIDAVALLDGPSTPTEIARFARLPVNVTNSQLNRLKEAGFVKSIKERGRREVLYDINERLFRLWRQMRVEAGRRRLRFIVKFIEIWFSPRELVEQVVKMSKELEVSLATSAFENVKEVVDKLYYVQEAAPSPLREAVHLQRAYSLAKAGDLSSAEQETQELEIITKSQVKKDDREHWARVIAYIWGAIGYFYHQKGKFNDAIRCYQRAIAGIPDYHEFWNNMGVAYREKDWRDEAIRCFRKAVEAKPDYHEAWYNMGFAYAEKGEYDEAISAFSKAIEFAEDRLTIARSLTGRGASFWGLGKYSSALKDAERAYRIAHEIGFPPLIQVAASVAAGAALGLSKKSVTRGNLARALEYLEKTLKYVPDIPTEDAESLLGQYFKDLVDIGNKAFMESAIQVIEESGQADLIEFLQPYRVALRYFEERDKNILNRLVPEIREIVEEIVSKLEGSG